jgi:hypothetical protein
MTSGGKRKGAGRPVGSTRPGRTVTLPVRITPEQRAKAKRIGGGNASEGLRIALDAFARPATKI